LQTAGALLLICLILVVIQSFMGLIQTKYYQKSVKEMFREYQGRPDSKLYTEVSKGYLKRIIVMAIIDGDNKVVDCRTLSGLTVFARFKRNDEYIGMDISTARPAPPKSKRKGRREEEVPPMVEQLLANMYQRKLSEQEGAAEEAMESGEIEALEEEEFDPTAEDEAEEA
jgi:glucitol operon activator protein